ncbi:MAG: hypothetical protein HRJ53_00990 [Acidobacteria bacterium Pan2503]|uniref:Uncharacterized protein n=1 Tax=Candidatus Acidiferrum panamense TaxID=2741543 RepID=A0A7V8SV51_9BACT|nr:hypothetical protein [Candidatus Acidoferrum panamensis]
MNCPLNAISGSLLPAGNTNGVLENMRVPAVVPAINGIEADTADAAGAAGDVTVIIAVELFMVSLIEVAVSNTVAGLGTVVGAL